ncbi:MAG: O-acetylserine/cysteine exporter [Hyphococcus sp.]|nr:MAG: O-acetylserine/cysteine exporter [Marinicaulis sp.]
MPAKDILLAFITVTIWGVSFSIVKVGLEELPPILFIAMRFLIVALPAIFFVPFPNTSIWNVVAVGILIGVIKFGMLFMAMRADASAGLASLILQAQIFFTIALSVFFLKETITPLQASAIAISIAGFLFFFIAAGAAITHIGLALILAAALAWAISNIIMKRMKDVALFRFMVWVSIVPLAPLFTISYFIETQNPIVLLMDLSPKAWFSIAYMGYLSTLAAYALWGGLLNRYTAAQITPFALLIPITGIFTANAFLDETLTQLEIAGALLVMLGLSLCIAGQQIIKALQFGPLTDPQTTWYKNPWSDRYHR